MSSAPILQTERLSLHRFEKGDAAFLLEIMNHPDYYAFIGDRELRTVGDAQAYIEDRLIPPYAKLGFGFWVMRLRETGERVGFSGIIKREGFDDADVGYAVHADFYGKGLAQEATQGVLAYAKEILGFSRVCAITSPNNVASINVLTKCDFEFDRKTRFMDDEVNLYVRSLSSP